MSEKLSFIHSADLHLDSPFKGLSHVTDHIFKDIRDSTFSAMDKLVDLAIEKNVDFLLIVGDLFDSDQQSVKAQTRLIKAFEKLKSNNIEVYISFGNHDYMNGRLFDYQYPTNVHVFDSEEVSHYIFEKNGVPLATIYGFSYQERAVIENKTDEFQTVSDTPYHIGMLHGSLASNTEHDVYAPFQINELVSKDFSYWALGHIHKRQILKENPPIIYPGNIQGRSKKEQGEKGCYFVELDSDYISKVFHPLQDIRFEQLVLDVDGCETIQDLEVYLEKEVVKARETYGKCILFVQLTSSTAQIVDWYQQGYVEEVVEFVNELNENGTNWAVMEDIKLVRNTRWNRDQLDEGGHFLGELVRTFNKPALTEDLSALFLHRKARKYIDYLTEEEMEEIHKEAEELLLHQLLEETAKFPKA